MVQSAVDLSLIALRSYSVPEKKSEQWGTDSSGRGIRLESSQPSEDAHPPRSDDIVSSWLNADDNVTKVSGAPSWASLAKALEACDHTGLASRIVEVLL